MPLFPLPVEQFGGLNLLAAPDETGFSGAVDMLNVDLDKPGRVRSRDGFAKFTSAGAATAYHSVAPFYTTAGTRQLIAAFGGVSGAINALNTSGGVVAAQAYANSVYGSIARFAAPGSEFVYVAVSQATGAATIYRWDGTTWTTPTWVTTTPTGRHLATWGNRLANARYAGTSNGNSVSTIRFSAISTATPPAATPETWNANDFVELSPGDGEEITALIPWRDQLFAFKESKFFVFFGTSLDSTGNPVFNYRPIFGQGLASAGGQSSYRAVAAAPNGVFFLNRRGVWFTSGGPAQLVSQAIDPLFRGTPNAFYQGGVLNQAAINTVAMAWHDNRLFIAFPSGSSTTNDKVLVYDPGNGYWLLWSIPASAMSTFRVSNVDELAFAFSGSVVTLSPPAGVAGSADTTPSTLSTASWSANGNNPPPPWYYKVTALTASGETTAAAEVSVSPKSVITSPVGVTASSGAGSLNGSFSWYAQAQDSNGHWSQLWGISGTSGSSFKFTMTWSPQFATGSGVITNIRIWREHNTLFDYSPVEYRDIGVAASFTDDGTLAWTASSFSGPAPTSGRITLTWNAVAGATGYRVYRGSTAGGESVFFAPGNVLTFTDTGTAGTAGTPPVTNTATTAGFDVGRYNVTSGYSADGGDGLTTGAAITSRYQSGFDNIAPPRRFAAHYLFGNTRKRLRKWKITGTGNVSFSTAHDFGSPGAATSLTLGVSITDGWHNIASRGQLFSYKLAGTSPWSVQKMTAYLAGSEPPLLGNPSDAA